MDQLEELNEMDELEQSSTSKTLLTGSLIFVAIIVLGFIFMPKPKKEYHLSQEKMLEKLLVHEGVIGPEKIVDLIYEPNDKYQFIDLRSAPEFLIGHLPNAINIPISHMFDKEYQKILKQTDKINVLYYSNHAGACGPWMILNQIGYKNNIIMLGGYDYVNESIINRFSPMSGSFREEKAKYDFARIISQTSGGKSTAVGNENKTANTPVIRKKTSKSTGGGC